MKSALLVRPRYIKTLVMVPTQDESQVHVDEIESVLNPVKAMDLRQILSFVPAYDRPRMALSFVKLNYDEWGTLAGFGHNCTNRWVLKRENKLPFGAALRLAKVFGVPADELFADWM